MQVDQDGNSRLGRSFAQEEEEEFIKMSRDERVFEKFSSSIAPSIYGSEGAVLFLVINLNFLFSGLDTLPCRHQKGHSLSPLWRLQKDSPRRHETPW